MHDSSLHKEPKVSLIVRCYNEEKFIGKLLHEVKLQNYNGVIEIVVVDSGSSDQTINIVTKYDVKLIQISPEDFTFGYSLNKGVEASSGEICVITSAHCYPTNQNWIREMITPFQNPKVAIVYGRQEGVSLSAYSEKQIFKRWFPNSNLQDGDLAFCNNANSAIRKSLWYNYPFNEELTGLEDLDWARYVKNIGQEIHYRHKACVYHIHEQSAKQVFNRYYREALAYREIYPNEHFNFIDFITFFVMNWGGDYLHAIQDGCFLKNILEIPIFRFNQFFGTYKAHSFKVKMNNQMKRRLFYPDRPKFLKKKESNELPLKVELQSSESKSTFEKHTTLEPQSKLIDISRAFNENTPPWPGVKPFKAIPRKTWSKDNFRDCDVQFNIHNATHADAPSHFVEAGKSIDQIPLERFHGKCIVAEYSDSGAIPLEFFMRLKLPLNTDKILIKTTNSKNITTTFINDFVAIKSECAQWLVDNGIKLIGIDGPSIQLFHDRNNATHEVLLKNDVIILENLIFNEVEIGNYNLYAFPLKLSGLEGAPIRAVLSPI